MHDESPIPSVQEEEQRNYLYREVGGALHLSQTLELYVETVVSILNEHFDSEIDADGLIVPDYRKTLGQLMKSIRSVVTVDEIGDQILDRALDRRNHIAHNFFNQNAFAFSVQSVFEQTKEALKDDTKAIAMGVAFTQCWVDSLCESLKIDKRKLLYKQDVREVVQAGRALLEQETIKSVVQFKVSGAGSVIGPVRETP